LYDVSYMVKTVIIVDDESSIRYTVKQGLETLDQEFNVICVENGAECLKLLKDNLVPDIILLDIMMPEMNGWEIQKRLKDNMEWKSIPIIFLTATSDDTSKMIGSMLVEDYIGKPFEIKDLKVRIDKILRK